jgi:hypothetical protein
MGNTMKQFLGLITFLIIWCSSSFSQTRDERVRKLPYRLMYVPKAVKGRLLKDANSIRSQLKLRNFDIKPLQKAYIKQADDKIIPYALDTTITIEENKQVLNNCWSSSKVVSTYFAFNGHSRDAVTNKSSGKFIAIEIEDRDLTGTVTVFYPIKYVNGKWTFTKTNPEFAYYERN